MVRPQDLSVALHALPAQLDALGRAAGEVQAALGAGTGASIQARSRSALDGRTARAAAARAIGDGGNPMPFAERIQKSFGRHDVSGVRAHTGQGAARANAELGSFAFATGEHVAFGRTPDLFTAAHEAAHVVQQRGGVSLRDGVGAPGDTYERHADEVASLVVRGASAEGLLDRHAGGARRAITAAAPVQRDTDGAKGSASTYDGSEIAPIESDAEFLNELANALTAEGQRRITHGRKEGPMSVQGEVGKLLVEEARLAREAMAGQGDWKRYLHAQRFETRDVSWCVDNVTSDAFTKAFEIHGDKLVKRIKLNCMKLSPLHATLVTLRESVKQVQDVFNDVADYLELIGYVEQLKSVADWIGIGVTRGMSTPNPNGEAALFLSGSSGGSGAALARQLASSKLVSKIGERNAVMSCYADGGDPNECFRLARGLDGTLREIARISDAIEADYGALGHMDELGMCAITNDRLTGCDRR